MKMSHVGSRGMLILFAIGLLTALVAGASGGKKTKYDQSVPIPRQSLERNGVCGALAGNMTAGDFFRDLERREAPGGIEFRKKSQVIREFPPELSVALTGTIGSCPTSVPNSASTSSLTDFINHLKVGAEWTNRAGPRPVPNLLVVRHLPRDVWWPETDPPRWGLEIKVPSKDVPLTDSLIISIQSEDGHRVMNFTVEL
jgi:hypothetical protein